MKGPQSDGKGAGLYNIWRVEKPGQTENSVGLAMMGMRRRGSKLRRGERSNKVGLPPQGLQFGYLGGGFRSMLVC